MSSGIEAALETGHVGLNVSNLERSKNFYLAVLGLEVARESLAEGRRFVFLSDGGKTVLTLWEQSHGSFQTAQPGLHHLSFRAESIEAVRAVEQKLRSLNVPFIYEGIVPHSEGAHSGGVFFEDPDGIRLEVFSPSGVNTMAPTPGAPSCGFF
jgi:catechol-2,3-dioxygenase